MQSDTTPSKPLVIAHRCNGFGHQENSLKAIRAALSSGADGIEFDIRLTKDRKWVVIHDPFYKDEKHTVQRVHEQNYSQLRRNVTLLDTILALVAAYPKELVVIDVKDVGEERQFIKLLHHYKLADKAVVFAWEPEILRRVHQRDPTIRLGMNYIPMHNSLKYVRGSINQAFTKHGVHWHFNALHSFDVKHSVGKTAHHFLSDLPSLPLYSIQMPAMLCTKKLVTLAHAKGIKVMPFQVTTLNYLLIKRCGVDSIITNTPMKFM